MTSDQRASVEKIRDRSIGLSDEYVAALTAALGTCGDCQHADHDNPIHEGVIFCTRPTHFYNGKAMQTTARCAVWTAQETP